MEEQSFAQRLQSFRKKTGLTQEKLAELLDLSIMTVRRWEWGVVIPRMNEIKKLAQVLKISEDELVKKKSPEEWTLQIKISNNFEEVINLAHNDLDCIAQLTTTKNGAALLLTGSYDIFADDKKFKAFIKQVQQARNIVLQNGRALGGIKD